MKKQYDLRYKINSEINIVPFLDILLVLLMIFMIIPSKLLIQQQGFEVHLPIGDATIHLTKNKKFIITIEIIKAGIYNFLVNDKKISHISLSTLVSEINSVKLTNSNFVYLIAASKEEKYNEIIKILSILNNIGINSIGLITYPTDNKHKS